MHLYPEECELQKVVLAFLLLTAHYKYEIKENPKSFFSVYITTYNWKKQVNASHTV